MKKMVNKIGIALAFLFATAIASAQGGISVTVNGDPVQFAGTGPQMVNGRVLVPLRGIFEKLGAFVRWVPSSQRVIATRGSDTVELQIGNTNATVNGSNVTLDVPAQLVNGSTMVPIRFVSESVGAKVLWREAEQTVVILTDNQAVDNTQPPPSGDAGQDSGGPVRMARVSWMSGGVTWRPGDDVSWSDAAYNLPLRQGAELWLNPGGSTEVQFDDGSMLRLGSGAVATLQTMYSDDQGEFTEIRLNSGTASLHLNNEYSTYQVDTPLASVTATGQASLRIDTNNGLRVVMRSGQAQVQGDAGQATVNGGQFLSLAGPASNYYVARAPGRDSWDQFCDQRDGVFQHPSSNLTGCVAVCGGDLGAYGSWVNVPGNGQCWRPNGVSASWAPYRDGHWVWVSPFGWTWQGNEPWGWTPYHYGAWVNSGGAWFWRPGPAQQYWSPAVVHFSSYNGAIAWCPLAPQEVRYPPAISIGFGSGNWAVHFSIGCAAAYYPAGNSYCAPHPWGNNTVNRTTNVYNVTRITNITNVYVNNGFVPRNSRVAGGATQVSESGFGKGGQFSRVGGANAAIFTRGKSFAPPNGAMRFAGPTSVRPSAASFSPKHAFTSARPSAALLNKPVFRAALPPRAAAVAKPIPNARVVPGPGAVRPNPGNRMPTPPNRTRPGGNRVPPPNRVNNPGNRVPPPNRVNNPGKRVPPPSRTNNPPNRVPPPNRNNQTPPPSRVNNPPSRVPPPSKSNNPPSKRTPPNRPNNKDKKDNKDKGKHDQKDKGGGH